MIIAVEVWRRRVSGEVKDRDISFAFVITFIFPGGNWTGNDAKILPS